MRKIIKGKIYDTATAKEIHTVSDETSAVTLFRKKSCEFFLLTCILSTDVKLISPISYDHAKAWLARNAPEKSLEPVHPENDKTKVISISVKESELSKIKQNAARAGMTVSAYIVMMCAE